jgi:hypothetical protein
MTTPMVRRTAMKKGLIICLFLALTSTSAFAARKYMSPKHQGYPLDGCLTWSSQCGKPAADAFCQRKGHPRAIDYMISPTIYHSTCLIGDDSICITDNNVRCGSFSYITCQ